MFLIGIGLLFSKLWSSIQCDQVYEFEDPICYKMGQSVSQSSENAVALYKLAADRNADAQYKSYPNVTFLLLRCQIKIIFHALSQCCLNIYFFRLFMSFKTQNY